MTPKQEQFARLYVEDGYTENREPKSRRLSETGGKHK